MIKNNTNASAKKTAVQLRRTTLIIVAAYTILSIGMLLVTYPTQMHRDSARGFSIVEGQSGNEAKTVDVPEYTKIMHTVSGVVQLTAAVAGVSVVYYYFRTHQIAKHAHSSTVWVNTIGLTVAAVVSAIVASQYLSYVLTPLAILGAAVGAFIFNFVICYIIALLFQWYYNRKHSFIVE